ncbi:MAG: hypothetical protein ACRDNS_33905, partial [Trebonia sp.]
LLAAGRRAGGDCGRAEPARLAVVWAVMHLSYGAGFLRGCVAYGPPIEALAGVLVPAPPARGRS